MWLGSNIDAGMRSTMEQLILLDSDQRPTNRRPKSQKVYPGLLRQYSRLVIEIT